MEPTTDEDIKPVTLILEKGEAISILLVLGNFVANRLEQKQISTEDFIEWEKSLNKLLVASGIPMEAQTFLRKLDAVVEILVQ